MNSNNVGLDEMYVHSTVQQIIEAGNVTLFLPNITEKYTQNMACFEHSRKVLHK